jgi:hypothetical protein
MLFFTPEEKKSLLSRLPALELSYGPKLHKKVYSPVYYVIPKGPKALVWYTYWKEQHVCLLIRLNERGNYSDVQVYTAVFSDALALGTIIYGTYFLHYNQHYFTCEQLYYYKGVPVAKKPYAERLGLLLEMFQTQVEQVAHTPTSLVVGMPLMTTSYEEAVAQLDLLPYKTYGIGGTPPTPPILETPPGGTPPILGTPQNYTMLPQGGYKTAPQNYTMLPQGGRGGFPTITTMLPQGGRGGFPTITTMLPQGGRGGFPTIFNVKAGLAADNYNLYTAENTFYETAMVPTYKCSVMMNALFRHIKENANLDLLEESDDDEEFENIQIDKFVDLEKTVAMECVYSKRFKKWQPVKIANASAKIISLKDLQFYLQK